MDVIDVLVSCFSRSVCVLVVLLYDVVVLIVHASYACVEILYITQGKSTNCNDALAKANVLWAGYEAAERAHIWGWNMLFMTVVRVVWLPPASPSS